MFAPSTRILIVDDMLTMRKLVAKALKDLGFSELHEAKDGAQGWETISGASPGIDLVISDLNMPVLSGLEFLKKARQDPRFKKLPFILLTDESEISQVSSAVQAGANGYIVKPFSMAALTSQLEKISRTVT